MFAVDRQERLALTAGFGGDQFSGGDQTLFVGESDRFSRAYGFVSGFESGHADDGADHEICFGVGGDSYSSSRAVNDFDFADARSFQPSAKDSASFSAATEIIAASIAGPARRQHRYSGLQPGQQPGSVRDRIQLR